MNSVDKTKFLNTCNDLVQVMEMGNELHSTLSQCTGHVYLMQTELPPMIAMSEKNYQLNYSESYTGNLHNSDSIIGGYQYSIPIDSAFESLLSKNYSSFILTIKKGCIGVSIYHTDNGSYKIFDSHARDEYGRSHPQGTCVLLEQGHPTSIFGKYLFGRRFEIYNHTFSMSYCHHYVEAFSSC